MNDNFYEKQRVSIRNPISLHTDTRYSKGYHASHPERSWHPFPAHWHENIELLLFLEGSAEVTTNTVRVTAVPGDLAVVNSNTVHTVNPLTEIARYHCLIVDSSFCRSFGIDTEESSFSPHIRCEKIKTLYEDVVKACGETDEYAGLDVRLAFLTLLTELLKNHRSPDSLADSKTNPKADTVKRAIEYMKNHFGEPLTVEGISREMGFTKYYFCHLFSEVTGSTVVNHLNYIRCKKAKELIQSGKYNITEAAQTCGFSNMSYFAKTYRSLVGELPSETKKELS